MKTRDQAFLAAVILGAGLIVLLVSLWPTLRERPVSVPPPLAELPLDDGPAPEGRVEPGDAGSPSGPGSEPGPGDQARVRDRAAPAGVSSSRSAMYQAGTESADLVLPELLHFYGSVTDPSGQPLEGVRVEIMGQSELATVTAKDGSYEASLAAGGQHSYTLRFRLPGYQEERLELTAPGLEEGWLDVQLEPAGDTSVVSGTVRTRRGEPLPGQTVKLRSRLLNAEHFAPTDRRGDFSIPDVQIGSDYALSIRPEDTYRDYSQGPFAVAADGLSLEIVLEPLASGRLSGRMINAEGKPIPGFRLWLVSLEAQRVSLPVSSDEDGYFLVEEAPGGAAYFDTRAVPRLRVAGIHVPERGEKEVSLVLDLGDQVIDGSVLDDRGSPVAGAEVMLNWSSKSAGMRSHSERKAVSDARGVFRFTRLGPGGHKLQVRASGYNPMHGIYDVGVDSPDLELRLESVSR